MFQGYSQKTKGNKIILILGSDNLELAQKRAEIGYKLYKSEDIDKIIVSGGCGAHGSDICEATEMKKYLVKKGVSENIIYKEEKSKNTAQNYCYSRKLKHSDGTKIIKPGDHLFVVSNHWHAIPVAGCFSKKDGVFAEYMVKGKIEPSPKDMVDYISIYKDCIDDDKYCEAMLD